MPIRTAPNVLSKAGAAGINGSRPAPAALVAVVLEARDIARGVWALEALEER